MISGDFRVLFDDAVAVWINDVLVFSEGIDSTEFSGYSDGSSGDNAVRLESFLEGESNPFVVGENNVSAIVKQRSAGSSDLSFDFELRLRVSIDLPDPLDPLNSDATLDSGGNDLADTDSTTPNRDLYMADTDVSSGETDGSLPPTGPDLTGYDAFLFDADGATAEGDVPSTELGSPDTEADRTAATAAVLDASAGGCDCSVASLNSTIPLSWLLIGFGIFIAIRRARV